MQIKTGFKNKEEAEKAASKLLCQDREQPGEMEAKKEVGKDKDGKDSLFYSLTNTGTGATAYISSLDGRTFSILFLSKDEANEDNRTYPFRGVPKRKLPFLMATEIRTPLFKPTEYITPKAVQSYQGMVRLFSFFGEGEYTDYKPYKELEGKYTTIGTAFDDLDQLRLTPLPTELSEITGIDINGASDYATAIASILDAQLTNKQRKIAEETYLFNSSYLFLRYAAYEFFRTERYDHLKEVLARYGEFGLPDDWERGFTVLSEYGNEETAERYILARYISRRYAEMTDTRINFKEVARYIGAPLPLLLRAYEHKEIYDF